MTDTDKTDSSNPKPARNSGGFDETLISGYLDGELTQSDRQRVALHLEDNLAARELYEQLREARSAALTTPFPERPVDDLWDETPRSLLSRLLLYVGWFLLGAAVVAGVGLWLMATGSEDGAEDSLRLFRWLPGAAVLGIVSVLVSVTLDRATSRRRDIYRLVKK